VVRPPDDEPAARGPGAFTDLLHNHPASVPFYFLKPERDLVRTFVRGSEATRPLWGLDQLFAFATTIALDRLAALAPSSTAHDAVERVRAAGQGDSLNAEALPNLPPALFDLTALHPLLYDGSLDPGGKVERLLWGFDTIVLIPNATPAVYVEPLTDS
jgi:hypothetical protein